MSKCLVYRVENSKREGPFKTGVLRGNSDYTLWNDKLLLGRYINLMNNRDYVFGFSSVEEFKEYFKEIKIPEGFKLVRYEVQDKYIFRGNYQLVFDKWAARLLN